MCYVLPYHDKKSGVQLAQFQLGAKGYIQLALRSGQFKKLNVRDVREGEIVGEDFASGDLQFKKLETDREKAKVVGVVAMFELTNGFVKQLYMTVEELEAHGKTYSQTYKKGYGLWADNKKAMFEKTCLKQLLSKYAPLSVEMQDAIKSDSAVIKEDGVRYIDNEEEEIDFSKAQEVASKFTDFEEVP